jgi:hypothetical protein
MMHITAALKAFKKEQVLSGSAGATDRVAGRA